MINLLSTANFRNFVPVNAVVDDSIISAAINHAQISLIPALTSKEFFNELIYNLSHSQLTPVQTQFLVLVEPALACFSAARLVTLAGNQIHPTQISDAMQQGSKASLINYYRNQTSMYLEPVYDYCEANHIQYNKWKSTAFCPIVLGGAWSRNTL